MNVNRVEISPERALALLKEYLPEGAEAATRGAGHPNAGVGEAASRSSQGADITLFAQQRGLVPRSAHGGWNLAAASASRRGAEGTADKEASLGGVGAGGRLQFTAHYGLATLAVEVTAEPALDGALVQVSVNGVAVGDPQPLSPQEGEAGIGTLFEITRRAFAKQAAAIIAQGTGSADVEGEPKWVLTVELVDGKEDGSA